MAFESRLSKETREGLKDLVITKFLQPNWLADHREYGRLGKHILAGGSAPRKDGGVIGY